jgi:arylformamidase
MALVKRREYEMNALRRSLCIASAISFVSSKLAFAEENLVYENWTQSQLNDQISQAPYIGDIKPILQNYVTLGTAARKEFPPKTLNYGSGADENLDAYIPQGAKDLPIMIFIHGGAWENGTNKYYRALAPTFIKANAIFIAINFTNIPPNTIPGMAKQCREAIKWVWKNARSLGGNPNKLYVSGHSSGGHLANVMLTTQWSKEGVPSDVLKGGLIMSGWTDLYPISLSDRQTYLKLDKKIIAEYSPIHHLDKVRVPVIVSWGALESPYMQQQSAAWAQKLQSVAKLAGVYKVAGTSHYEMPNQLCSSDTSIAKATLAMMDLI